MRKDGKLQLISIQPFAMLEADTTVHQLLLQIHSTQNSNTGTPYSAHSTALLTTIRGRKFSALFVAVTIK